MDVQAPSRLARASGAEEAAIAPSEDAAAPKRPPAFREALQRLRRQPPGAAAPAPSPPAGRAAEPSTGRPVAAAAPLSAPSEAPDHAPDETQKADALASAYAQPEHDVIPDKQSSVIAPGSAAVAVSAAPVAADEAAERTAAAAKANPGLLLAKGKRKAGNALEGVHSLSHLRLHHFYFCTPLFACHLSVLGIDCAWLLMRQPGSISCKAQARSNGSESGVLTPAGADSGGEAGERKQPAFQVALEALQQKSAASSGHAGHSLAAVDDRGAAAMSWPRVAAAAASTPTIASAAARPEDGAGRLPGSGGDVGAAEGTAHAPAVKPAAAAGRAGRRGADIHGRVDASRMVSHRLPVLAGSLSNADEMAGENDVVIGSAPSRHPRQRLDFGSEDGGGGSPGQCAEASDQLRALRDFYTAADNDGAAVLHDTHQHSKPLQRASPCRTFTETVNLLGRPHSL